MRREHHPAIQFALIPFIVVPQITNVLDRVDESGRSAADYRTAVTKCPDVTRAISRETSASRASRIWLRTL